MKKYIPYLVIFLIGALAGMWAHRQYHFRDATNMSQNDTIVKYDTLRYSRFMLENRTAEIKNLFDFQTNVPRLLYIPTHSLDTIYRDNIQYVTLPRQFYFTETEDAQIWHSGIDSTIDSLNVFRKSTTITQTIQPVTKRNALSVGIEGMYMNSLNVPAYVEYESRIKTWLSAYGRVAYNIPTREWGIGLGVKMKIEW